MMKFCVCHQYITCYIINAVIICYSPPPRHSDTQGSVDTITSLTPQVKETLPAYDIQTNPNVPSPARVRWLDACNKVIRKLTEVSRRTMLRLIKSVGTLYDLLTVAHTQNLFL